MGCCAVGRLLEQREGEMRVGGSFAPRIAREALPGDSPRVISKNVALRGFSDSGLCFFVGCVAKCQVSAGEKRGGS